MKYRPEFPDRFGSIQDSRVFSQQFFTYYNTEHHHSGIGLMTPEAIHYGWAEEIYTARQDTLLSAYDLHPERFVRKTPEPPKLPTEVWINPPPRIETEKLVTTNEDTKKTKEAVH